MNLRTQWLISGGLSAIILTAYGTGLDSRASHLAERKLRVEQLGYERESVAQIVSRLDEGQRALDELDMRLTAARAKLPPRVDHDPFQDRIRALARDTRDVQLLELTETDREDRAYARHVSFLFEVRGTPAALDQMMAALRAEPYVHGYTMIEAELESSDEITLRVTGESLQSL